MRVEGPECPRCGVLYAKARPRAAEPAATQGVDLPPRPEATWHLDAEEAALERRLRQFALPIALLLAWGFVSTGFGAATGRMFAGMWLHELGHAASAWLCSIPALPGPWRTSIAEERSWLVGLLVLGGAGAFGFHGWTHERRWWAGVSAAIALLFFIGVLLPLSKARALYTFGGDAGGMVLGTVMMLTLYAREDSQIRRGWLRWGFLVLGAIGFMDASATWWRAMSDVANIPFGHIEGVGLSDAARLDEEFGWTTREMTQRYVGVSIACLAVLLASYLAALRSPRN